MLQVVCDHKLRFTYVAAGQPGNCTDKHVFNTSVLGRHIREMVPEPYYLAADSGFNLTSQVLIPFPHLTESDGERRYNATFSAMRTVVERGLGRFKGRFRAFHDSPIHFKTVDRFCTALLCAVILHNIAQDDAEDPIQEEDEVDVDSDEPLDGAVGEEARQWDDRKAGELKRQAIGEQLGLLQPKRRGPKRRRV